jgi:hypothetical protein
MTVYGKAWLFLAWAFVLFLTSPFWMGFLIRQWAAAGLLAGLAFWLAQGWAALRLIKCPECGASVFERGKGPLTGYAPWPRRICGECGANLAQTSS